MLITYHKTAIRKLSNVLKGQGSFPKYTITCLLNKNKLSDNWYPTRC